MGLHVSTSHISLSLIGLFVYCGSRICISTEFGTGTVNKDLLKVVTLDKDLTLKENDSSKYDFQLKGLLKNQPEYNFKSGSKCVGVKYGEAEVWVYDFNKNQNYPTSVKLDPVSQTLWVQLDTFDFYTFQFSETKWKFNDQVSSGSGKGYDETLSLSNFVENLKETVIATVLESSTSSKTVQRGEDTQTHETRDEQTFSDQLREEDINLEDSRNDKPEQLSVVERHDKSSHIIKVLTLVDDTLNCNDITEYDLITTAGPTVFKFKCGSKNQIKYEGNGQSENDKGKERGIKPLKINIKMSNFLMVNFSPDKGYQCTYKEWRRKPGNKSTLSKELDFDKLRVVTLSDDGLPVENDTSKYDRTDAANIAKYKFKEASKCTELKYNNETVWKYDRKEHGDNYPVSVALNKSSSTLMVDSSINYLYLYAYYNSEWKQLRYGFRPKKSLGSSDQDYRTNIDKFVFVTLNDDGRLSKNDTTKYETEDGDVLFLVKLKQGSKCTKVIYDQMSVWNYDGKEHGNNYPASVALNKSNNLLLVDFNKYQYYYSYNNNKWDLVFYYNPDKLVEPLTKDESYRISKVSPSPFPDQTPPGSYGLRLVSVNINDKESTPEFDYFRDEETNLDTYAAKTGFKFNKVVKEGDILWESSDSRYLVKFDADFSHLGKVILSLYYDSSGTHVLQIATDPHPDPLSIPSDPSRVTLDPKSELLSDHLKVLTLNDEGSSTQVSRSKFSVQSLTDLLLYTFRESAKCTDLKYDNVTVWKHDSNKHGLNYPNFILLNNENNFLYVESTGFYQYSYSFYNDKWNQVSGYPKDQDILDPNKLELITLNGDGTVSENDTHKYDIQELHNLSVFTFKEAVKCTIVRYDGYTLWKYDENEFGQYFPTMVTINTEKNCIMVDSINKYRYVYSYHKKWRQELGYKSTLSKELDFDKLRVVTLSDDGLSVENDTSKYDRTVTENIVKYKFKEGCKCTELKYNNETVWKYDRKEHGDNYPILVALNKSNNLLFIESFLYQYYYHYNNKWNLLLFLTQIKIGSPLAQSYFTLDHSRYASGININSNYYKNIHVPLNYNLNADQNSTRTYDIRLSLGDSLFKFNSAFKFGIREELYTSNEYKQDEIEDDFPIKMRVKLNDYFMYISFNPYNNYLYTYDQWEHQLDEKSTLSKEFDFDKLRVVTLSDDGLSVENDTSKYDRTVTENIAKYKFKEGSKCTELKYNNETAWSYDPEHHEDKYPTLVALNVSSNFLFVESEGSYRYTYSYYNDRWNQVSVYKAKEEALEKLDPNKLELVTTNTQGKTTKNDSSLYERKDVSGSSVFKFNRGVKCVMVSYDGHTLWEHSEEEFGTDFPTSVTLKSDKSYVMVESSSKYRYMYTYYDEWKEELGYKSTLTKPLEFEKVTVVTLEDDQTTKENDTTKYARKDSTYQSNYKFNTGTKCTEVKYDGVTVWKHNVDEYSNDYPDHIALNKYANILLVDFNKYQDFYLYYNFRWHFLRLYNPNKILQSIFNAEFEPTQIIPPSDQLQPTFRSFEENDGLRQDSTHQESKLLQVESSPHLN